MSAWNKNFWHPNTERPPSATPEFGYPMDRWLCLVIQDGKVYPDTCVWFSERNSFSVKYQFQDQIVVEWMKLEEIEAWGLLRDLPPWFG